MKHLKIFKTESERAAYIAETPLPTYPYVHYVEETKGVEYSGAEVDIPFYFESIEGLSVKFSNKYQYSRDGVSWSDGTSSTTITFNTGERVYFRATGLTASSSSGIGKFTISTGTAKIGGNLMSMLYGEDYRGKTTIEQPYAFQSLFQGCSRLKSAKRLALPATTLVTYCYSSMFRGCTSLVNAPALPAATLVIYCYSNMFSGCSKLNYIKAMFTTNPSSSYTSDWVNGVAAEGTFVKNAEATWNVTGVNGVPSGWTIINE